MVRDFKGKLIGLANLIKLNRDRGHLGVPVLAASDQLTKMKCMTNHSIVSNIFIEDIIQEIGRWKELLGQDLLVFTQHFR